MAKVSLAGTTNALFEFSNLIFDEFVPIVKFDRDAFTRPESMRLTEVQNATTLSEIIDKKLRTANLFSFLAYPETLILPFNIEKGLNTIDDDGLIVAKIEPPTQDVEITSTETITAKYGGKFYLHLKISGHQSRTFKVNFYASDDEDDFNSGECRNIHCGQIEITTAGSSQVGYRLISNIDALPKAPAGYWHPEYDTTNPQEITTSQKQANQYNDCEGVCYATTASRAQKAYRDVIGKDVIDLSVRNSNIDHLIASSNRDSKHEPRGYGAGGAFVRHKYGLTIDNKGVWDGKLKRGALLQLWYSTDINALYSEGGHSVIFRNYIYDDNGVIIAINYTDYHGGTDKKYNRSEFEFDRTILGVNLLDAPQ